MAFYTIEKLLERKEKISTLAADILRRVAKQETESIAHIYSELVQKLTKEVYMISQESFKGSNCKFMYRAECSAAVDAAQLELEKLQAELSSEESEAQEPMIEIMELRDNILMIIAEYKEVINRSEGKSYDELKAELEGYSVSVYMEGGKPKVYLDALVACCEEASNRISGVNREAIMGGRVPSY